MKNLLKLIVLTSFISTLNADSFSIFLQNDIIENGKDEHYTNGVFINYLTDKDTNSKKYKNSFYKTISKIPTFHKDTKYQSLGLTYSNLTFTPQNIKRKEKIENDLPYAGVNLIDLILYKWDDDFFHEYITTLGFVGPSTKTKQIQKEFHNITGHSNPNGWDNQLEDDFLYNFTYSYGHKTYKKDFKYGKIDVINNLRVNLGNYNRSLLLGSMFRYGNNYPDNFNTVGRFLGSNENKLLNLDSKINKDFAWSISYGLAYSYTDFFYVNDFDSSYKNEKIKDSITQVISLDAYLEKFIFSLSYKRNDLISSKNTNLEQTWGGITISYLF